MFPQYGRPDGLAGRTGAAWHTLPINGFLNHLHWSMCASSQTPPEAYDRAPSVSFVAESDDTTLSLWPHKFTAVYTVSWQQLFRHFVHSSDSDHSARKSALVHCVCIFRLFCMHAQPPVKQPWTCLVRRQASLAALMASAKDSMAQCKRGFAQYMLLAVAGVAHVCRRHS